MHCAVVQKHLPNFHDAEFPSDVKEAVARHLVDCAPCRAELARLEVVAGMWSDLERAPVPSGFAGRVMRAARERGIEQPRAVSPWATFLQWWRDQSGGMRAASAAVVVGASVVGVLMSGGFVRPAPAAQRSEIANSGAAMAEQLGMLSGAPHGSLEQTYWAWTFRSEPRRR